MSLFKLPHYKTTITSFAKNALNEGTYNFSLHMVVTRVNFALADVKSQKLSNLLLQSSVAQIEDQWRTTKR